MNGVLKKDKAKMSYLFCDIDEKTVFLMYISVIRL